MGISVPVFVRQDIVGQALIDPEDYDLVKNITWRGLLRKDGAYYAQGSLNGKNVLMHRLVMNAPDDMEVDHINLQTLDNRKQNLRLATHGQNGANTVKRQNTVRQYHHKGVDYVESTDSWVARITIDGKSHYLGIYETEKEAAIAYDQAAYKAKGEYARLNYPNSPQWTPPIALDRAPGRKGDSGIKGVSFHKGKGKWQARITKRGSTVTLGTFLTKEEAAKAWQEANEKGDDFSGNEERIVQHLPIGDGTEYRGVTEEKIGKPYRVAITHEGNKINLGSYDNAKEAALVYDAAVRTLDLRIKNLNFPNEDSAESRALVEPIITAHLNGTKPNFKGKGPYRGVSYREATGKWYPRIVIDGKNTNLGYFSTPEEAARAYDEAAKKHHPNPKLNFPDNMR